MVYICLISLGFSFLSLYSLHLSAVIRAVGSRVQFMPSTVSSTVYLSYCPVVYCTALHIHTGIIGSRTPSSRAEQQSRAAEQSSRIEIEEYITRNGNDTSTVCFFFFCIYNPFYAIYAIYAIYTHICIYIDIQLTSSIPAPEPGQSQWLWRYGWLF